MQQPKVDDHYAVGGALHAALNAAATELASMPKGEQRTWHLRSLAALLIGRPEAYKAFALRQCPELETMEPLPDTYLMAEEEEAAAHLTQAELLLIDAALIAGSTKTWRKMSRSIGDAMVTLNGQLPPIPLGLYVRRVQALVQAGQLLGRGNTKFKDHSEICLPGGSTSEA